MILIFFSSFHRNLFHPKKQRGPISRQHLHLTGMASDPVEHFIRWNGCGRNSWQSRCDMDRDGAQENENGHELFYRLVAR